MLEIVIPEKELWDESKEEFTHTKAQTLRMEHSLVSLSKWESKWKKAFLSKKEKTYEETIDYIRCMTVTQNVDPDVYKYLSAENIKQINEYINDPMTATTFSENKQTGGNHEILTAEVIYYYMIASNIPFECQKWHLNKLLTLIRVCSIKNQPPKKMGREELLKRNNAVNAARRKKFNTKG